jgi:hypothetical protein
MEDTVIDHGSNISGISLLLNVEKISNSVDIDDMERKVKNMYIDAAEETIEDEEEDEANILEEYEQAIEDIASVADHEEDEEDEDEEEVEGEEDEDDAKSIVSSRRRLHRSGFINDSRDSLYMQKTRDEQLQSSISRVMENVPKVNIDMEQEIEDERKNTLLEQIESLRDDLVELGSSVDGTQYYASYDAPLRKIEEVHRRLTFKYNKLKYNSIAEEALVAGASLLEMVFNGKHTYFGVKPDITGYSDVVKSKLKRIRVETSTAVSRFVSKNQIGVMPRLMMELLPSLITQSQRRKLQVGDSLNANISCKKNTIRSHLSDLNHM